MVDPVADGSAVSSVRADGSAVSRWSVGMAGVDSLCTRGFRGRFILGSASATGAVGAVTMSVQAFWVEQESFASPDTTVVYITHSMDGLS